MPMTTPAPAPSPQTGAPLVTYVLPPMAGKSCAVLDAERDWPSNCQTSIETGSPAQSHALHTLQVVKSPIPSCVPWLYRTLVPFFCLYRSSLWLPSCPCYPLFCLTGAYPSLSLLYPDACYSPLGLARLPMWTPPQHLEHTTRAAPMEAPTAGPGPREDAYAEWHTQPLYLQLDLLRPRNLTGQ